MKLSVSLPDDDIAFLDSFVKDQGARSRSAAVHRAIRLLRAAQLSDDYAAAWDEWADSGDAEDWLAVTADGLST